MLLLTYQQGRGAGRSGVRDGRRDWRNKGDRIHLPAIGRPALWRLCAVRRSDQALREGKIQE